MQTLGDVAGHQQAEDQRAEDEADVDRHQQQVAPVPQHRPVAASGPGGGRNRQARRPPAPQQQDGDQIADRVGRHHPAQPGGAAEADQEGAEGAAEPEADVAQHVDHGEPARTLRTARRQHHQTGARRPVRHRPDLDQPGGRHDLPDLMTDQEPRVPDRRDQIARQRQPAGAPTVDQWTDRHRRRHREQPGRRECSADQRQRELGGAGEVDQHEREHQPAAQAVDHAGPDQPAVPRHPGQAESPQGTHGRRPPHPGRGPVCWNTCRSRDRPCQRIPGPPTDFILLESSGGGPCSPCGSPPSTWPEPGSATPRSGRWSPASRPSRTRAANLCTSAGPGTPGPPSRRWTSRCCSPWCRSPPCTSRASSRPSRRRSPLSWRTSWPPSRPPRRRPSGPTWSCSPAHWPPPWPSCTKTPPTGWSASPTRSAPTGRSPSSRTGPGSSAWSRAKSCTGPGRSPAAAPPSCSRRCTPRSAGPTTPSGSGTGTTRPPAP